MRKKQTLISLARQCDDDVQSDGKWRGAIDQESERESREGERERERGRKKRVDCCIVVSHFLACYKQAVNVSAERRPSRR